MTVYEKVFSYNIRKYRKQYNLTQKMLAEATGYSEKTVSKWVTFYPTIYTPLNTHILIHTL